MICLKNVFLSIVNKRKIKNLNCLIQIKIISLERS